MVSYKKLFDQRGSSYDLAMRMCPDARRMEFEQVIEAAALKPGMSVADVPAGGGYLGRFLPPGCNWLGHEPCASFAHHAKGSDEQRTLLPLPWPDDSVDAAISLAGIHHIENKPTFFAELFRITKPGGRLVISDVAAGSKIASFLDGYIGHFNSTGHEGLFVCDETLLELEVTGWSILSAHHKAFHWVFSDRNELARFCHALFDIRHASYDDVQAAVECEVGVKDLADGRVGMLWELMTITADKKPGL